MDVDPGVLDQPPNPITCLRQNNVVVAPPHSSPIVIFESADVAMGERLDR